MLTLRSAVRTLCHHTPLALNQWFGSGLPPLPSPPAGFRYRWFDPATTFWLFLWQMMDPGRSCREALAQAHAWLGGRGSHRLSSSTSAYCQARARLVGAWLERIHRALLHRLEEAALPFPLWKGRRVLVADGTGVSMPDTPANQACYPQVPQQKPGCGFPVLRLVGLFSLVSGAWLEMAFGPYSVGEGALFRTLWSRLRPRDVLLADRGFCSFAHVALLGLRQVDCVLRLHARRSTGLRLLQRFSRHDRLVEWFRRGACPSWLTPLQWRRLPPTLCVRHVAVSVRRPGYRTRSLILMTTLLDPRAYPPHALAELYLRRWQVELFLRDIKCTLAMDVLRCHTPALIHKELRLHQIAYNMVRALILQAAAQAAINPRQISFAGTLATLRQWAPVLASASSPEQHALLLHECLLHLAADRLPCRPGRREPRAVKRRPKNYQFLTQARSLFHEVPHRSHCHRGLT